MTLGDTCDGLMMLKMYQTANHDPARKINYNIVITSVSILSGLTVALIAAATLLTEQAGWRPALLEHIAAINTESAGYLLAGFFAAVGLAALLLWRRTHSGTVRPTV